MGRAMPVEFNHMDRPILSPRRSSNYFKSIHSSVSAASRRVASRRAYASD